MNFLISKEEFLVWRKMKNKDFKNPHSKAMLLFLNTGYALDMEISNEFQSEVYSEGMEIPDELHQ